MSSTSKIALLCAVLIALAGAVWIAAPGRRTATTLTYSQFLERVRTGQVANVVVMGSGASAAEAICRLKDGNAFRTVLPSDYRDALAALQDRQVDVEIRDSSGPLVKASPFLVLLGVWVVLMTRKVPPLGRLPL